MKLDILVFGAHPDDAEIGMGGTIAKHTAMGLKVGICDLTLAELSSNGDPVTRQAEAAKASKALGLSYRSNLQLPDRGISSLNRGQIERMTEEIRKVRPDIVFAPYIQDRHPDHIACGEMVKEAVFNAKLRKWNPSHSHSAWQVRHFYYYFINDMGKADFIIDISEVYDQKREGLLAFESQFSSPDGTNDYVQTPLNAGYLTRVEARDSLLGQSHSVAFAEGFVSNGPLLLSRLGAI